jgi:tetratricopeptide (TPR) repeat protein
MWGASPSSFHSVNLLLMILAVVSMLLLVAELLPHRGARAVAVLLLVTHPLVTESVQSVAGQAMLITLVCTLLAGRWLVRFRQERHSALSTGLVLGGLTFLAAGVHEIGLLLPLLMVLLMFVPVATPPTLRRVQRGRVEVKGRKPLPPDEEKPVLSKRRQLVRVFAPMACALVAYLVLRYLALGHHLWPTAALEEARTLHHTIPLQSAGSVVAAYLRRILFPLHPTLIYSPLYESNLLLPAVVGWGILLVMLGLSVFLWLRYRLAGLGLVWMLLPLLALGHFIPLTATLGELPLLLSLPGLALLAGACAGRLMSPHWAPGHTRVRDVLVLAVVGAVCLAMTWQTWTRGQQWKSVERLWQAEASIHPDNPIPLTNLVDNYRRTNQLEKAQELLAQAKAKAQGVDYDALILREGAMLGAANQLDLLGTLLDDQIITTHTTSRGFFESLAELAEQYKMTPRAEVLWQRELKNDPRNINALGSLADLAMRRKEFKAAIKLADEAVKYSPADMRAGTMAHYGQILAESGHLREAEETMRSALQLDPGLYLPYRYLIRINSTRKEWDAALSWTDVAFSRARVATRAELAQFFVLLLEQKNRESEALDKIMLILASYPQDLELRVFVGQYLMDRQQWDKAEQVLLSTRALAEPRRQAEVLTALAVIQLRRDRNRNTAEQLLKQALDLDSDNQEARRMLDRLRQGGTAQSAPAATTGLGTLPAPGATPAPPATFETREPAVQASPTPGGTGLDSLLGPSGDSAPAAGAGK